MVNATSSLNRISIIHMTTFASRKINILCIKNYILSWWINIANENALVGNLGPSPVICDENKIPVLFSFVMYSVFVIYFIMICLKRYYHSSSVGQLTEKSSPSNELFKAHFYEFLLVSIHSFTPNQITVFLKIKGLLCKLKW
jgi:hypothetical protein